MYENDLAYQSKYSKTYKILKHLSTLILELFSKNLTQDLIFNIQVVDL